MLVAILLTVHIAVELILKGHTFERALLFDGQFAVLMVYLQF